MSLFRWLMRTDRPAQRRRATTAKPFRPRLEALEARDVPSAMPPLIVHAGGSIQAALDAAAPGALIVVEPGTYAEALTVAKPNLTLVGFSGPQGGPVLVNPGDADDGITVTPAGAGFVLSNLAVGNFNENGVRLLGVDHFLINAVSVANNGEYGIFPVFSAHGVIQFCTAFGHKDTGIYVGQSIDVVMQFNTTFGNVNGLEIENSFQVTAFANNTFANTAGILEVLLPGLPVTAASNNVLVANYVHDNNRPNDGVAGDLESFVPAGIGILVLGADHTLVTMNFVTGNTYGGISVASTRMLTSAADLPPAALAGIDPDPDGTRVVGNLVLGNGTMSPIPFLPVVDLLWDGSGKGNSWNNNRFGASFPSPLPRLP